MSLEDNAERPSRLHSKRRAHPRYLVDELASMLLVHQSTTVLGRITELSLGGCRIRTAERFLARGIPKRVLAGALVRVEVAFEMLGVAFRLSGVTQWTDSKYRVGIRFLDLSARKREQLLELVEELEKLRNKAQSAAGACLTQLPEQGSESGVPADLNL